MSEKFSHLTNLVSLIYEDGKLDKRELEMLYTIAERYDIEEHEIIQMLNQQESYDFVVPENPEERKRQISDIIEMMMVDNVINPGEMSLVKKITVKMGFPESVAEELLEKYKK